MGARRFGLLAAALVMIGMASVFGQGAGGGGGGEAPASTARSAAAAAATAPSELRITLMDGSILAGKLSVADLTIDTKFGTLKVPVDVIQSFAPGLNSHPELEQQINSLVADLGADAFPDREKANQALLRMGPELTSELQRQLKNTPDTEVERQNRLTKILEDFDALRDEDADTSGDWTRDDVIVTAGFTIVGKITTSSFAMVSPYGTLQVKLSDVRKAARASTEPEEFRKSFTVSGSTIAMHNYTPSGLRLNKGDQVVVTAAGSVRMTPWGSNAVSGPDGGGNYGVVQPGNIPGGCLVARIGPGGSSIKAGSKCTFTADHGGTLEFGIAMPSDYGSYQFPGEYQVKVRVIRAHSGS